MTEGQFDHLAQCVDRVAHAAEVVVGNVGAPFAVLGGEFGKQLDDSRFVDVHDSLRGGGRDHQPQFLQCEGGSIEQLPDVVRHVGVDPLMSGSRDRIASDQWSPGERPLESFRRSLQPHIGLRRRKNDASRRLGLGLVHFDEIARADPGIRSLEAVQPDDVDALVFAVGTDCAGSRRALADNLDNIPLGEAKLVHQLVGETGKAAAAYELAKLVIKLINNLAGVIDADPDVHGRLKVIFLPDYCVSLAERLISASDVSNQISTAGYEASGTSNMKFMMNGALTIGTRDGATIEMAEEAGEENFFLFGLNAEQVANSRNWYSPQWHYDNEPETRAALDLILSDYFSRNEPGVFGPLSEALLNGDHYMHLADLQSYLQADQQLCEVYSDAAAWSRKAILNVASSGKFSSDRTIAEYATDIWKVGPCPVE